VNVVFGDIVAVNGQPAKGVYVGRPVGIALTTAPKPGQAIADTTHTSLRSHTFQILKADGTVVGTVMSSGLDGGQPPPGAPSNTVATRGDYAILGGTIRFFLHVIPMTTPQIVTTAGGPAVTHSSDFTLVTVSKPAAAGEILSLFATGLGPTNPGVDPGQPFPSTPAAAVNSPVDVTVHGKPAEVLGAVGYPGAVDGYQVNFRVPPDTAKGVATIQVSAAWVASTAVNITVQTVVQPSRGEYENQSCSSASLDGCSRPWRKGAGAIRWHVYRDREHGDATHFSHSHAPDQRHGFDCRRPD
jgi:hypothetical protein